jgi:hypothetical protein
LDEGRLAMHVITVSPDASTELAIAALITAAAVLAGAITRIVLSVLAVSVTRKTLEDPPGEPAEAAKIRAHHLAVLKAILAALTSIAWPGRLPRSSMPGGGSGHPPAH